VTFKVRRRALSPRRQALLEGWLDRWGLSEAGPVLDWAEVFGESAAGVDAIADEFEDTASDHSPDVVLDIGFGHGESTSKMALADPSTADVGIEMHTPGVATLLESIERDELHNVRVVHGDALMFLDRVGSGTLGGARIFFPDPWPKVRQHHRRIVSADVVRALVDRLRIGGTLHLATDISDYAEVMQRVCDAEPQLEGGVIDRPDWRPLTRFEQRGLDEARDSWDLLYRRVS